MAANELAGGHVSWSALVELSRVGDTQRAQALLPAIAGLPVTAVAQLVDACLPRIGRAAQQHDSAPDHRTAVEQHCRTRAHGPPPGVHT